MKTMHHATVAVAVLTLSAAIGSVHAATPINQSRPLDPRGTVEVSNAKGRIEVRTWNRPEVRIEGSLGDGVEKLEIDGGGQRLRVKVKHPSRSGSGVFGRGGDRVEPTVLRLMVPLQADLSLSAVSADVLAWGTAGSQVRIENVSGDTTLVGAPGVVRVESISGNVDLTVNRANVDAESVSGNVKVSGRLGEELDVETVSGRIEVRVLDTAMRRIEGSSVSGDIDVRAALAARARVSLETVSGGVDLSLPRNVSAEVRAESFSGNLRAPGATVDRPRHGPGANLRHRYGGGDAEVSIETFSGNAQVRLD